jgi:large subunit ribosomal protein L15
VGRGIGSKLGKTAGAGNKGQKSRKGFSRRPGFEGGQMPLHRRIPKRGFHSPFRKKFNILNLEALSVFPSGDVVTPESLRERGVVRNSSGPVKILGEGELNQPLTVRAQAFSKSAEEKIVRAGGKIERLP